MKPGGEYWIMRTYASFFLLKTKTASGAIQGPFSFSRRKSYQQLLAVIIEKADLCTVVTETRHLVNAWLAYSYITINGILS